MRSISSINKFNKLRSLIVKFPILPNVVCIQETWLKKDIVQIYDLEEYRAVHCCRDDSYRGTTIYVRNDMPYTVEISRSSNFIESAVVALKNRLINGKELRIVSFYRSPKCTVDMFLNHLEEIATSIGRHPCIILGDSNIDLLKLPIRNNLLGILQCYGYKNCHELVTRPSTGSCIDHIYSNVERDLQINSIECQLSDHNLLCCHFESDVSTPSFFEVEQKRCDFGKVKMALRQHLSFSDLISDTSHDMSRLTSCFSNAIANSTSVTKKKRDLRYNVAPWINGNLISLIEYKNKLLRLRKKSCYFGVDDILKRLSRMIKISMRVAMDQYYIDNLNRFRQDPKKCWKFLNKSFGRSHRTEATIVDDRGEEIVEDKARAQRFNDYFVNSIEDLRQRLGQSDGFNSLRTLRYHTNTFKFKDTTVDEILSIIRDMDVTKSAGFDDVSVLSVRECAEELSPYLTKIFNDIINTATFPSCLKIHKAVYVHR
ncbi:uncharacterized protein LOC142231305 [Haematobia irritans]|uniref:uncharacterized protein LOC142231305 n=1 Tax=Haematobia irritans TaxID=7368 RepID=UPI003F5080A5